MRMMLMKFEATVHPLEAYYIINNHIQQAPSLYTLLSTRLVSAQTPSHYNSDNDTNI